MAAEAEACELPIQLNFTGQIRIHDSFEFTTCCRAPIDGRLPLATMMAMTCGKGPCVTAREPLRLTMRELPALPAPEVAVPAPPPGPPPTMMEVDEGFLPLAQTRPRRGA